MVKMTKNTLYREDIVHKSGSLPMKIYKTDYVRYHWHDEYEFLVAVDNSAQVTIDGKQITINKGDAVLVQSGALHSLHLDVGSSVMAIVVSPKFWAGTECAELFERFTFSSTFLKESKSGAKVIDLLKKIIGCYFDKPFGYELRLKSYFCDLFLSLIDAGEYTEKKSASEYESSVVRGLFEYVHTRFYEQITLDSLCKVANYSKSYVIKVFKKHTGQTPNEYINRYRVEMAKELLSSSDKTVLDVSLECGFYSVSYFIKTFKQSVGVTPHKWRNL